MAGHALLNALDNYMDANVQEPDVEAIETRLNYESDRYVVFFYLNSVPSDELSRMVSVSKMLYNAQVGVCGRYRYIAHQPGRPELPRHSFPYTMKDLQKHSGDFQR
jgi:hypothetical protein